MPDKDGNFGGSLEMMTSRATQELPSKRGVYTADGRNTDPQSMDYPNGLLQWTTQMDYPKMDYP